MNSLLYMLIGLLGSSPSVDAGPPRVDPWEMREELSRKRALEESLKSGRFGLSTAVNYPNEVRHLSAKKIGPEVEKFPHLESIDLYENLPHEALKLPGVTTFFFSGKEITAIPDWFWNLNGLTSLYIRDTSLAEIPVGLARLKNLRHLVIGSEKPLQVPDAVGDLHELKVFSVEGKGIKQLPSAVGKLRKLSTLYLSGSCVTQLPPEIGQLTGLKQLNFEDSCLTTLPTSIGNLRSLRAILGAGASLESLPEEIGLLTQLETIELSRNKIKAFPWKALSSLPNLEVLTCMGNPKQVFPKFVGRLSHSNAGNYFLPPPVPAARPLDPVETKAKLLALHAAKKAQEIVGILRDYGLVPWSEAGRRPSGTTYFQVDTTLAIDLFEEELFALPGEKQPAKEVLMQVRIFDQVVAHYALAVFYLKDGVWTMAPSTFLLNNRDNTVPPLRFSFAAIFGHKSPRRGMVGVLRDWSPHEEHREVVVWGATEHGIEEWARETMLAPDFHATKNGSYSLEVKPKGSILRVQYCPHDKCKAKSIPIP